MTEREHWSRQPMIAIIIKAMASYRDKEGMAVPAGKAADEIYEMLRPALQSQRAPVDRGTIAVHLGTVFPNYSYDERYNIADAIMQLLTASAEG